MKDKIARAKEAAKRPIKSLKKKDTTAVTSAKVPYITNDTIAEHREEVLSGARKYIYPLQHSRRRIVWLSLAVFVISLIAFLSYSILSLYNFQNTSNFTYRITQILPFPIARAEGRFVSYESYLFELRHSMHYYEVQQKLNFESEEGKEQLKEIKNQAINQVIEDAYVKQLAEENGIGVTSQEVDNEIAIVKRQNRFGTSDQVFEDVLRDFWGWSVNDFKRSLRQQILARKVASNLDKQAHETAKTALGEIRGGLDFGEAVTKYSEDEITKANGGDYGIEIDQSNRDISALVTGAIFSLKEGQVSEVIDTGYSLEIVKLNSLSGSKAKASHIQINLNDIGEYVDQRREQNPPRVLLPGGLD